jgi:pyrimidine-nucleoside phosphorylase
MDTTAIGVASVALGAGRARKEDSIDHSAGIVLRRKTGDRVARGDVLAVLHTSARDKLPEAEKLLRDAIIVGDAPPAPTRTILARVTKNTVERL